MSFCAAVNMGNYLAAETYKRNLKEISLFENVPLQ